jgi:flavin-dependent dehydrogenase
MGVNTAMKYDLIVVGGGPGGLMAAKVAAESGLSVLLIERRKEFADFRRACLQLAYLKWITPDGYVEPFNVDLKSDNCRFVWPKLDFSLNYDGPLVPYTNAIWISPSDYMVYPFKNELFAYYYPKESFEVGLFSLVEKAGVEIRLGTIALGAENTVDGVNVFVQNKTITEVLEAKVLVAADGVDSRIVESLGLNNSRQVIGQASDVSYILEGIECTIPEHQSSWLHFECPTLPNTGLGRHFGMGTWGENKKFVGGNWKDFAMLPAYSEWFRNARVVKEMAMSGTMRTPILEPIVGNIVIISDAAAPIECWRQGAVACGYMAVKAIERELNGQKAYPEYIDWWQKAFYFNEPGYMKRNAIYSTIFDSLSAEEIDYIYQLFQDQRIVPQLAIAKNPELLKKDRPDIYEKLEQTINQVMKSIEPLIAKYPPEADGIIYGDASSEVYLGQWRSYPGYD